MINLKGDKVVIKVHNHAKETLYEVLIKRREQFLQENKQLFDIGNVERERDPHMLLYIETLLHMEKELSFFINMLTNKILDEDQRWQKEQEDLK